MFRENAYRLGKTEYMDRQRRVAARRTPRDVVSRGFNEVDSRGRKNA